MNLHLSLHASALQVINDFMCQGGTSVRYAHAPWTLLRITMTLSRCSPPACAWCRGLHTRQRYRCVCLQVCRENGDATIRPLDCVEVLTAGVCRSMQAARASMARSSPMRCAAANDGPPAMLTALDRWCLD